MWRYLAKAVGTRLVGEIIKDVEIYAHESFYV
jgi:hypothetical protein